MANEGIKYQAACLEAAREMGKPVIPQGFNENEVGGNIVNVLYYAVEYQDEKFTEFRMMWFVNGKNKGGSSIGQGN